MERRDLLEEIHRFVTLWMSLEDPDTNPPPINITEFGEKEVDNSETRPSFVPTTSSCHVVGQRPHTDVSTVSSKRFVKKVSRILLFGEDGTPTKTKISLSGPPTSVNDFPSLILLSKSKKRWRGWIVLDCFSRP